MGGRAARCQRTPDPLPSMPKNLSGYPFFVRMGPATSKAVDYARV
ncbi:MAG: hypothetical protein WCR23_01215 [Planctomycetota bacterium]|nr:hypothetical protein [Planctomycetia bacterium]